MDLKKFIISLYFILFIVNKSIYFYKKEKSYFYLTNRLKLEKITTCLFC